VKHQSDIADNVVQVSQGRIQEVLAVLVGELLCQSVQSQPGAEEGTDEFIPSIIGSTGHQARLNYLVMVHGHEPDL
jgi:hypothetical protein